MPIQGVSDRESVKIFGKWLIASIILAVILTAIVENPLPSSPIMVLWPFLIPIALFIWKVEKVMKAARGV